MIANAGFSLVVVVILATPLILLVGLFSKGRGGFGDIAAAILPLPLWFLLVATNLRPKSLSNFAVEAGLLLALVGVVLALRLFVRHDRQPLRAGLVAVAATTMAAASLWLFVPLLPE